MKLLFTILIVLFATVCRSQYAQQIDTTWSTAPELIKVKIKKIRTIAPVTTVWMKTMDRPRVKLRTECICSIPYRKKDIVFIIKP